MSRATARPASVPPLMRSRPSRQGAVGGRAASEQGGEEDEAEVDALEQVFGLQEAHGGVAAGGGATRGPTGVVAGRGASSAGTDWASVAIS